MVFVSIIIYFIYINKYFLVKRIKKNEDKSSDEESIIKNPVAQRKAVLMSSDEEDTDVATNNENKTSQSNELTTKIIEKSIEKTSNTDQNGENQINSFFSKIKWVA